MPPKTIASLARAVAGPLPGPAAQYQMAPGHRAGPEVTANPPQNARLAAVLILLYIKDAQTAPGSPGDFHIPMMLRPARTGPHSGQISFPGGARELHDPDLAATALRESEEELSIVPADVRIVGALSKIYVPPSGYLVSPYVGWSMRRPDFIPDPREVDQILEIPLAHLLDPANRASEERDTQWGRTRVPYFSFSENEREHKIWGASAMILSELLAVLRQIE
ncbi:MAG: CoA pyrophosphatase [Leptospirales bacterium]